MHNSYDQVRDVLRVPFTPEMGSDPNPELPENRRWKGPCLGYQMPLNRAIEKAKS
jgi:hypothetical protein